MSASRSVYLRTSRRGLVLLLGAAWLVTGCASLNRKEQGALIGAGVGAGVGGVIGNQTGSTARGALIGAVVGGATGAIIGHQMDQQAKEIELAIPGATVERVGEGIQVTFDSGLLYDFDSDRVKAEAAANLRQLARSLEKYPRTDVLIVGHTDATGADDYNTRLSLKRAESAARFLMGEGVASPRLRTSGRGEMEPLATNDTDAGRQANRRIEVAIIASPEMRKNP